MKAAAIATLAMIVSNANAANDILSENQVLELKESLKQYIDKILWANFEYHYIGMNSHMTFLSKPYEPNNAFKHYIQPLWVSLHVIDEWYSDTALVDTEGLANISKSVNSAKEYFDNKAHWCKKYAHASGHADYVDIVKLYEDSYEEDASAIIKTISDYLDSAIGKTE